MPHSESESESEPNNLKSQSGFALVISLSLMAFVLLLLLSIITLVQVESQSSNIQKQQTAAQQQALLGLQLALGELQRTAGPDQRVTATADILTNSNASKRNTVGVWSSEDLNNDGTPDGTLLRWLSSDAVDTNGLPDNSYNEDAAAGIILVGAGSLPDTNNDGIPDDTNDAIVIDVSNTTVTKNNATVGRYGWWIGDEGVKGRINLTRPDATGQIATKQRGVLETGGSSTNSPSALIGLTGIDFDSDAGLLQQLNDLELIPGGVSDANKHYFHDLTTHSAGVLADVKNGGLKKDLSLAFEMSDTVFDSSEFASGGNSSTAIMAPGYTRGGGLVQPVFSFDAGSNRTAIGPVWNLLRQYYRLYQQVSTPMGNPTFNAQAMGPSIKHSNPAFQYRDDIDGDNNNVWGLQSALQMGGGPALTWSLTRGSEAYGNNYKTALGFANNSWGPSNAIGKINPATTLPMIHATGDPLLKDSGLPVMIQSSYAPYLMRVLKTDGIAVKQDGTDTTKFQMFLATKDAFVLHNPYNVTINHPDMSLELITTYAGFEHTISGGGTQQADNGGAMSRAYIESGSLAPGKIQQYNGNQMWTKTYAEEYDEPAWHRTKFDGAYQNIGGKRDIAGNETFTATPFAGRIVNSDQYAACNLHLITSMRGSNGNSVTSGNHMNRPSGGRWPVTSAISTTIIGPGTNYSGADTAGSDHRFTGLLPVSIDLNQSMIIGDIDANQDRIVPLITYDLQLRPAEFQPVGSPTPSPYPTYALTNPMAPVKDNKNLFPLDDLLTESTGYSKLAPGWELTVISIGNDDYFFSDYDIWGPTDGDTFTPSGGVTNPTLLEIPTTPLQSLGQLQHANITVHAHMPALAIGNSLASPYIPRNEFYTTFSNRYDHDRIFYDISYLMNEALWDEYFFSSYSPPYNSGADKYGNAPSVDFNNEAQAVGESFDTAFGSAATGTLPNSRMQLMAHHSEGVDDIKGKLFDSNDQPTTEGFLRSAENLMVSGAFNINSTSVEAWRTVLSGARNQAIYRSGETSPTTPDTGSPNPISRLSQPLLGQSNNNSASAGTWAGFRALTDEEIEDLAQEIVDEIKLRANDTVQSSRTTARPYISLAEFINREKVDSNYGLCGILQAAIDKSEINDDLAGSENEVTASNLSSTATGTFPNPTNINTAGGTPRTGGMAAPTHLMQADILQAIGSFISPRSDTFRIRSYGESLDPITGAPNSKAWCEAVVQRIPIPVTSQANTNPVDDPEYWSGKDITGNPFPLGRRFKIISFRWLSENEV